MSVSLGFSFQATPQRMLGPQHSPLPVVALAVPRRLPRVGTTLMSGKEGVGEEEREVAEWGMRPRAILGALAIAGAAESSFLTYTKLFRPGAMSTLCGPSGSCGDVLTGPFSSFLGVPLTLLASGAYALAAILALAPLLQTGGGVPTQSDTTSRSLILVLTTAMASFSGYLMSVLAFKLHAFCPFCVASAAISFSMCGVAWANNAVPNKTKAAVMGACTTMVTVLASLVIFLVTETAMEMEALASGDAVAGLVQESDKVKPPSITATSSPEAIRISKKLAKLDSKMYGAYWCSHCNNQKQILGAEAFSRVRYVECSRKGWHDEAGLCKAREVPGYPTWEIGGELYPGEKTLEELAEIVGLKI
ncbi:unnamed protein product [Chrysoparadoxa australica]